MTTYFARLVEGVRDGMIGIGPEGRPDLVGTAAKEQVELTGHELEQPWRRLRIGTVCSSPLA